MTKMNAAMVTREVKRQLRLANLPAYPVNTRFTHLSKPSPAGRVFAWQTFVHGLDSDSIETVELVMGNVAGLIDISRHGSFLSLVVENR